MSIHRLGEVFIASGQMAIRSTREPVRDSTNCRNCGSSTYKVEIAMNQTITVCAHCGTRDIATVPFKVIDISTHDGPGTMLLDPSDFKSR